MDGIDSMMPILLSTRPKCISFNYGTERVTLMGVEDVGKMAQIDVKAFSEAVQKGPIKLCDSSIFG